MNPPMKQKETHDIQNRLVAGSWKKQEPGKSTGMGCHCLHLVFQGKPLIDNKQSLIEELQKKIKKLESQLERKVDEAEMKPMKEKVCEEMY